MLNSKELALRDELEFEKETRNTFITLLSGVQEKRRQLSIESFNARLSSTSSLKKKNRKSMNNLNFESLCSQTVRTVDLGEIQTKIREIRFCLDCSN
jgi:hypothetical protein